MERKSRRKWETTIEGAIRVCGFASVVFVALIFIFLVKDALPALRSATLGELLAGQTWRPTSSAPLFGMLPLIVGSALVTAAALVLAIPLGVACAVFVSEVAPPWLREILKPVVELLAAIPSVVFGFVGLALMGVWLQQSAVALSKGLAGPQWLVEALNMPTGLAAVTGATVLAFMALPTIISIAEDALSAVPKSYRQGSLALGATRWQTVVRVTIPAAKSGLLAAVMLGVGRVVGETMTVLMVTGNSPVIPSLTRGLFRPVRTMTATVAAEMGETAHLTPHYHVLFMLGTLLLLITFALSTAADYVTHKGKHVEHR